MPKTSLTPRAKARRIGANGEGVTRVQQVVTGNPSRVGWGCRTNRPARVDNTFEMQLEAEAESFIHCAGTNQFSEGVRAFLKKRSPDFRDWRATHVTPNVILIAGVGQAQVAGPAHLRDTVRRQRVVARHCL